MNILAIGAHFDDVELGCGGSLLYWKEKGHDITIFIATLSGYHDSLGNIVRSNDVALAEGNQAAKFLGANLITGNFHTFELQFAEPLNQKLITVINQVKPDLVLTHWVGDIHHDHRELGLATLHCCRHVPKLLTYCSNWYESNQRFDPRLFVDISCYFDQKIELIKIYQSENLRTNRVWIDYVSSQARLIGLKSGTQYSEGFEIVRWCI